MAKKQIPKLNLTIFDGLVKQLSLIKQRTLADKELIKNLILPYKNGYRVFDKFVAEERNGRWYISSDYYYLKEIVLSTAKNAIAWCIAYDSNNKDLAHDILYFDRRLTAKEFNVSLWKAQLPVANNDVKEILKTKIDENLRDINHLRSDLKKCIKSAKYIKIKGSSDELTGFNSTSDIDGHC